MANFTACSSPPKSYTACNVDDTGRLCDSFLCVFTCWSSILIAVLSPVAVVGMHSSWRRFWRRLFLERLFISFWAGWPSQICVQDSSPSLSLLQKPWCSHAANPGIAMKKPMLILTIEAIGEVSATYSIAITVFLITLMSVERWLHMSRRSLISSRRGYLTIIVLLLLPVPLAVLRYLDIINENDGHELITTIITVMLFCYLTTAFAYFKVYQVIRHHQQRVQASEPAQNIGYPSIDLAKYKTSVATILYILLLFSLCFLPYVVSAGIYLTRGHSSAVFAVSNFSLVLLFLSSALNPGLYLWRMKDIRNGVKHLFRKPSWGVTGRNHCFYHIGVLTGTCLWIDLKLKTVFCFTSQFWYSSWP